MTVKNGVSRRQFVKTSLGVAAAAGFPTIVPSSVFGQMAPSKRINVDLPQPLAPITALKVPRRTASVVPRITGAAAE